MIERNLDCWYTNGTEQPIGVLLHEYKGAETWLAQNGNDTFEAEEEFFFHEWADAWRFYLSFMERVRNLIDSFDRDVTVEELVTYARQEVVLANSKLDKGR